MSPRSTSPSLHLALGLSLTFALASACGGGGRSEQPPGPLTLSVEDDELPPAQVGVAYNADLQAAGGREPYSFAVAEGALPPGLRVSASFGRLTGTPTEAGEFAFTIGLDAADGQRATLPLTLTVRPEDEQPEPLQVGPAQLPDGSVGVAYRARLEVTGATPPTVWTIPEGALPQGLELDFATGVIEGVPAQGGDFELLLVVVDDANRSGSARVGLRIATPDALSITTTSLGAANRDEPYEARVEAAGGVPPYTWRRTGDLPPGLEFRAEGLLTGTPTRAGAYDINLTVTDSAPVPARVSRTLPLDVRPPVLGLQVETEFLAEAFVGYAYNDQLMALGGLPPYTWRLAGGALPAGLSLAADSGIISGTPADGAEGVFAVLVEVTDNGDERHAPQTATADLDLSVFGEPARPRLLSATADDASRGGTGIQAGDTLTLRFDRSTNAPEITPLNVATYLEVVSRSFGGFAAAWSSVHRRDDTLVVTFNPAAGGASDIRPGDEIRFPLGGLTDRSGQLGAVGRLPHIQGSFGWSLPVANSFGVRLRMLATPTEGRAWGLGQGAGRALAVGDLTGDGQPELVLVAAAATEQAPGGSVLVVSADGGLPYGELDLADGPRLRARFDGARAAAVGDVTGDGFDDLVLGTPEQGLVRIFAGGPGFPSGTVALEEGASGAAGGVAAASGAARFGAQLWVLQLVGDATPDLVVSAPLNSPEGRRWGGSLYVFEGGAARLGESAPEDFAVRLDGPSSFPDVDPLGAEASLAGGFDLAAGDFTGDGAVDLAVGYTRGEVVQGGGIPGLRGEVMVLPGALAGRSGVVDLADDDVVAARYRGSQTGQRLGHRVAFAELTGDGQPDLVFSAPGTGVQGREVAGAVYVLEGGAALPDAPVDVEHEAVWHLRVLGPGRGSAAGTDFGVGDVNRDGFPDLVVGAPGAGADVDAETRQGQVYVVAGSARGLQGRGNLAAAADAWLRFEGDPETFVGGGPKRAGLGAAVWAGDLDGDGVDDVVAAAGKPPGGGAAYVLGVFREEGPVLVGARLAGSTLRLQFNRPSNLFAVNADNLGQLLALTGRSPGGFVSANWETAVLSNDTLAIVLDGSGDLRAGDTIRIGAGTVRDELGRLDAAGSARLVVP